MRSKYGRERQSATGGARQSEDIWLLAVVLTIVGCIGIGFWHFAKNRAPQPQNILFVMVDTSGSNHSKRRLLDSKIVYGCIDRLPQNTQVRVFEYSNSVEKTFIGTPSEAYQLTMAMDRFKSASSNKFGTYPALALEVVASEIRKVHVGEGRIAIIVLTDGEDCDPVRTRSVAAELASSKTLRAVWFVPVSARFRLSVEENMGTLGERLISSGEVGDVNDGVQEFFRKLTDG